MAGGSGPGRVSQARVTVFESAVFGVDLFPESNEPWEAVR